MKSWNERILAVNNTSDKYITRGWNRTKNPNPPNYLNPKISLSSTDNQFVKITNDPYKDNYIKLKIVIHGEWYYLYFKFDAQRYKDNGENPRICLPDVYLDDNGKPVFSFAIEYDYIYASISSRYIVGVDVGKTIYAAVVVWDTETEQIVHSTTLSHRFHSLHNSVKATDKQKNTLYSQGRNSEASLHRLANVNKKRELAILAAQEVAVIAHDWDNSVVVVEDLSGIENTMRFGRWNRGEFVRWLEHYVELNGSRLFRVWAGGTSQQCHVCGDKVSHPEYSLSKCDVHGVFDRDINAAANIAQRFVKSLVKVVKSRSSSRKYVLRTRRHSPATRNTLKYPGRDRSKNIPTIHRQKRKKVLGYKLSDVRNNEGVSNALCSLIRNDDGMVISDDALIGASGLSKSNTIFNKNYKKL